MEGIIRDGHGADQFMGYCPFCGKPMLFTEEKAAVTKACPICTAPISFAERPDVENGTYGYEIVPAFEGESFSQDGFAVENGLLLRYEGEASSIATPSGVVAIAPNAFRENKKIKSVVLSEGVKFIGNEAFYGCEGIRQLRLPQSLVSIGNAAFSHCRRLSIVTLPEGLRAGGYAIFHTCENLTELLMPMEMTFLGGSPYGFCKKLRAANIPHCVRDTGPAWFQYNDALETLTVGRSVNALSCPSQVLREVHFHHTEGWQTCSFAFGEQETLLPERELKNPKTAAALLRKLGKAGKTILRPDVPGEEYWLIL